MTGSFVDQRTFGLPSGSDWYDYIRNLHLELYHNGLIERSIGHVVTTIDKRWGVALADLSKGLEEERLSHLYDWQLQEVATSASPRKPLVDIILALDGRDLVCIWAPPGEGTRCMGEFSAYHHRIFKVRNFSLLCETYDRYLESKAATNFSRSIVLSLLLVTHELVRLLKTRLASSFDFRMITDLYAPNVDGARGETNHHWSIQNVAERTERLERAQLEEFMAICPPAALAEATNAALVKSRNPMSAVTDGASRKLRERGIRLPTGRVARYRELLERYRPYDVVPAQRQITRT